MPLQFYNSLTQTKEALESHLQGKRVGMYVCGPTVYDEPHIGHARSVFCFELIRNYLTVCGYEVCFVRNVTDVDDKIIERARKEGGDLRQAVQKVSERYLDVYQQQMKQLGIRPPDEEPRATAYISQMQQMIQEILGHHAGYVAGSDVYFDITHSEGYGKLSKRNPEEMLEGTRGEPSQNKHHPLDFALWKGAKPEEPSWESPWGSCRPGWHIECSTMSTDIFKKRKIPFVIHGGGLDLLFPHHENEVAQAKGAGRDFATLWLHNGLVTVDGQKMSKSLGNFVTLKEIFEKVSPEVIRFYFLQTHYRSPLDFSWEKLEGAKGAYERFLNLFERVKGYGSEETRRKIEKEVRANLITQEDTKIDIAKIEKTFNFKWSQDQINNFYIAMDDNLNTPNALASLFLLLFLGNDVLNDLELNEEKKLKRFYALNFYIRKLGGILSLFKEEEKNVVLTLKEEKLIQEREEARKKEDFKTADEIRKQLLERGIILSDSAGGVIWRRAK